MASRGIHEALFLSETCENWCSEEMPRKDSFSNLGNHMKKHDIAWTAKSAKRMFDSDRGGDIQPAWSRAVRRGMLMPGGALEMCPTIRNTGDTAAAASEHEQVRAGKGVTKHGWPAMRFQCCNCGLRHHAAMALRHAAVDKERSLGHQSKCIAAAAQDQGPFQLGCLALQKQPVHCLTRLLDLNKFKCLQSSNLSSQAATSEHELRVSRRACSTHLACHSQPRSV